MKRILGALMILGVFISSCNIPVTQSTEPGVATAAALTIQAVLTSAANVTPHASPTATLSASVSTESTPTPTFSQPIASVGEITNCRKGPGKDYERVTQILPNESVKIIGFFPPNYWVVSTKLGDCWLSGEFTTPMGSIASVPTVSVPPTLKADTLEAATFPKKNGWTFFCYGPGQADITLTWNDKADNESGYKVLRDNEVIVELSANSTNFAETIDLDPGKSVEYKIRAYNSAGETDSAAVNITCP